MNDSAFSDLVSAKITQLCIDCGDSLGSVRDLHKMIIGQVERPLIKTILNSVNGNQVKAAQILGVNRNTLRKRMKEYNLESRYGPRTRIGCGREG